MGAGVCENRRIFYRDQMDRWEKERPGDLFVIIDYLEEHEECLKGEIMPVIEGEDEDDILTLDPLVEGWAWTKYWSDMLSGFRCTCKWPVARGC